MTNNPALFGSQENMMLVTVTGVFKELQTKDNREQVRHFNRAFTIVPEGAGYCIRNEMLYIGNPTSQQEKQFAQSTAGPSTAASPAAAAPAAPAMQLTDEVRQQMTLALSQQTNMNIEWSLKCLEEVQWNFDNARAAFQEAFSLGKIPPGAFTK